MNDMKLDTPLQASRSALFALALTAGLLWPALSQASELLMFERGGCVWCQRWDREVGPLYDKTAEAKVLPLRRVDVDRQTAGGVTLASPVRYTPRSWWWTTAARSDASPATLVTMHSGDCSASLPPRSGLCVMELIEADGLCFQTF